MIASLSKGRKKLQGDGWVWGEGGGAPEWVPVQGMPQGAPDTSSEHHHHHHHYPPLKRKKKGCAHFLSLVTCIVHIWATCYIFLLALLHADTLDCLLPFLPHPLIRAHVHLQFDLADMIPSHYLLPCTISI